MGSPWLGERLHQLSHVLADFLVRQFVLVVKVEFVMGVLLPQFANLSLRYNRVHDDPPAGGSIGCGAGQAAIAVVCTFRRIATRSATCCGVKIPAAFGGGAAEHVQLLPRPAAA